MSSIVERARRLEGALTVTGIGDTKLPSSALQAPLRRLGRHPWLWTRQQTGDTPEKLPRRRAIRKSRRQLTTTWNVTHGHQTTRTAPSRGGAGDGPIVWLSLAGITRAA